MAKPLYHPLAQSLAMVHHEKSRILAITLLIHWLKGCPKKKLVSPQKLKVLKAVDYPLTTLFAASQ